MSVLLAVPCGVSRGMCMYGLINDGGGCGMVDPSPATALWD